ncbi:MAG: hypothetical protein ACP5T3_00530 [Candidatus Micrarchaeia archaeon]
MAFIIKKIFGKESDEKLNELMKTETGMDICTYLERLKDPLLKAKFSEFKELLDKVFSADPANTKFLDYEAKKSRPELQPLLEKLSNTVGVPRLTALLLIDEPSRRNLLGENIYRRHLDTIGETVSCNTCCKNDAEIAQKSNSPVVLKALFDKYYNQYKSINNAKAEQNAVSHDLILEAQPVKTDNGAQHSDAAVSLILELLAINPSTPEEVLEALSACDAEYIKADVVYYGPNHIIKGMQIREKDVVELAALKLRALRVFETGIKQLLEPQNTDFSACVRNQ